MPTLRLTNEIILAAITGFESQKTQIDAQIAELRAMPAGGSTQSAAMSEAPAGKRRKLSAAARERMKEGQQRRWAKVRGESGQAEATPKAKRTMSAAGRKAIADAQRKRWAASKKVAEQSASTPARGKMSPARRAALAANLAKARAARSAKKAAITS